jgi:hypothetical protein
MLPPWLLPRSWMGARAAVERLPNRWDFGSKEFMDVVVEFSADGEKWDLPDGEPAAMRFARVTAPSSQIDILFLRAVGGPDSFKVPARSVAAADPVRLVQ